MTDIVVDDAAATSALDQGRAQVEDVSAAAKDGESANTDPRVAELLRAISDRTGADADKAGKHAAEGSDAARAMTASDEESASAIAPAGAGKADSSSRITNATIPSGQANAGQQQAQMAAQQQMASQQIASHQMATQQAQQMANEQARQQMMAAAQQQMMVGAQRSAAMAMSAAPSATAGLPAGTILVDPSDLASLIEGGVTAGADAGIAGSAGSSWNGSTAPEPIDVNDVAYEKTHGIMSPEDKSKYIDSALDKTGITDPGAREKFKDILSYMSEEESGDDANAVNNWDSNAVGETQVDGSPAQSSRGPWQTIPTTFAAHHAAGTSHNIYDPEASAGAAINYMKDRYNIGDDGSGLDEFYAARAHGRYVGY